MEYIPIVIWVLAGIGGAALLLLLGLVFYPHRKNPLPALNTPIAIEVKTCPVPQTVEEMYLDTIKKTLTRALVAMRYERHTINPTRKPIDSLYGAGKKLIAAKGLELVRVIPSDPLGYLESGHAASNRMEDAETMIGTRQLDNLQFCITDVIQNGVPGDVLEAGVWRGGASIFMRAVLKVYGKERRVWVADSFEGLPNPDKKLDSYGWNAGDMAVSLEEVKANFARYGLLDENVRFLKGFFSDTLPNAPIGSLAVLRVDADLYESTMDVLKALYPRLSAGGYAVFDDYHNLPDCRKAIEEYRRAHNITEEIKTIDTRAVFWRKAS